MKTKKRSPEEGCTLSERAFNGIQNAIVMGELLPGEKINEKAIGEQLGVSRGPLREAIRRLEEQRLVVRIPYAGVRVAKVSYEELIQIYEVREMFESSAAGMAATAMSDGEKSSLGKLLEAHRSQIESSELEGYYQDEGDMDFHFRIVMGCGNQVLRNVYQSELYHRIRLYRYRLSTLKGRPPVALKEHFAIYEAILDSDGDSARFLMKRHIQKACENLKTLKIEPLL